MQSMVCLRGWLRDALKVEPVMPAVALRRGLTRIRERVWRAIKLRMMAPGPPLAQLLSCVGASDFASAHHEARRGAAPQQSPRDNSCVPAKGSWVRVAFIMYPNPALGPRNFRVYGSMEKCPSGYGAAFRNTLLLPNSSASAREFESRLLQPLVSSSPTFLARSEVGPRSGGSFTQAHRTTTSSTDSHRPHRPHRRETFIRSGCSPTTCTTRTHTKW